jgi:glutaredoxin
VLAGFNDLQTWFPDVAKEWNYEKNEGLLPSQVMPGNSKKVWWKCRLGHEWQSSPSIRTREKKPSCPYCVGKKVLAGFNDLQTCFPDIAAEWNMQKNGGLRPSEVTKSSGQTVWWKCPLGHEWQAKISNRTSSLHTGCPYCANKKVLAGFNDLQTWNPDTAAEWNFEKNGDLLPSQIFPGSDKKVWWKCHVCGHEWQAKAKNRTGQNKTGCPYCKKIKMSQLLSDMKLIPGENDLQTCFPDIAAEWNNEKNHGLMPDHVMSGSNKKVWWKCVLGHEWQTTPNHRTSKNKTGCPYCANRNKSKNKS